MKDGIVLHPEYGLNPSIELCIVCGEEMGIALLGNNIKGQAPHHILQQQRCLYRKVRSIYSKTFTRQRPTNYIIMSWINSDGRGVIRNISQKQNYARC